jgi:hypothetical protein
MKGKSKKARKQHPRCSLNKTKPFARVVLYFTFAFWLLPFYFKLSVAE